jgi:uncharacterized protein (TIGR03435 family)
MRIGAILLLGLTVGAGPQFEVASVKLNVTGGHQMTARLSPAGQFSVTTATLKDLIGVAWGLPYLQVAGAPGWTSSDRWDVQAKAAEGSSQSQVNEMLQGLLAERFHLKSHIDEREGPVYDLQIAKNGPKLSEVKSAAEGSAHTSRGPQASQGHGMGGHGNRVMTTAELAQILAQIVGRPVIDKTGLAGKYQVALSWAPEPGQIAATTDHMPPGGTERGSVSSDSASPSIFTAVQEQLGLRLESARGQVPTLIIDSVQKATQQ